METDCLALGRRLRLGSGSLGGRVEDERCSLGDRPQW